MARLQLDTLAVDEHADNKTSSQLVNLSLELTLPISAISMGKLRHNRESHAGTMTAGRVVGWLVGWLVGSSLSISISSCC